MVRDPTKKEIKWHFSLSETVSTDWQYILKRKANAYNTLKQKYRHYFFPNSRPWHALHCLIWICNSHLLIRNSGQKSFSIKKRNKKQFQWLFSISSHQLQIFVLYTIRLTRLILIHLGKTRHLVVTHK